MLTTTEEKLRLAQGNYNRIASRMAITSRYDGRYKLQIWLQIYSTRIDELMRQRSDERMAAFQLLAEQASSPR